MFHNLIADPIWFQVGRLQNALQIIQHQFETGMDQKPSQYKMQFPH